jgi:homoserine acetyltransferase
MRSLKARLAGEATLVELSSLYGHDAFLKEGDALQPVFARALDEQGGAP